MMTLVIGGAASGKSNFAENLVASDQTHRRIYLATMCIRDQECVARVDRHRSMRAGKAFDTIECPRDLDCVSIPPYSAVLLEDLSNLAANEYFGESGPSGILERIMRGIRHLNSESEELVIVSNEIFSDGIVYDSVTTEYLDCLSALNQTIAAEANCVYEVVCGIPTLWKG